MVESGAFARNSSAATHPEAVLTPPTLNEALEIRKNSRVIPLAGGTDLMVRKRGWSGTLPGFEQPVLFIGGIAALQEIGPADSGLRIGAAATLSAVQENQAVPEVLRRAIAEMASPAIRNLGTLGGNICNASPAADTMPPLYALGATVVLQSASGQREVALAEFIKGPGQTDLRADELLVAVTIPAGSFDSWYYKKVGTRKADALSKISFAGLVKTANGTVADIRIALGAVAPRVVRSRAAEDFIVGRKVSDLPGLLPEIKSYYQHEIRPIDDQRSNAAYRSAVSYRLIEHFIMQVSQRD